MDSKKQFKDSPSVASETSTGSLLQNKTIQWISNSPYSSNFNATDNKIEPTKENKCKIMIQLNTLEIVKRQMKQNTSEAVKKRLDFNIQQEPVSRKSSQLRKEQYKSHSNQLCKLVSLNVLVKEQRGRAYSTNGYCTERYVSPTFESSDIFKQDQNSKDKQDQYQTAYQSLFRSSFVRVLSKLMLQQNSSLERPNQDIIVQEHGKIKPPRDISDKPKASKGLKNYSQIEFGENIGKYQQEYFQTIKIPTGRQQPRTNIDKKPPKSARPAIIESKPEIVKQNIKSVQRGSLNNSVESLRPKTDRTNRIFEVPVQSAPDPLQDKIEEIVRQQNQYETVGALSFVDTLTIDYRKTLNEYKNKIMAEQRRKAVSSQFQNMHQIGRIIQEGDKSFQECLSVDPFKYVFEQKEKRRKQNVSMVVEQIKNQKSKRDIEKLKLLEKADQAVGEFAGILTADPIQYAYNSKQSGGQAYDTGNRNNAHLNLQKMKARQQEHLQKFLQNQIQDRVDQMHQEKKAQILEEQAYLSLLKKQEQKQVEKDKQKAMRAKDDQKQLSQQIDQEKERQELLKKIQNQRERDHLRGGNQVKIKKQELLIQFVERNVNNNIQNNTKNLAKFLNC